MLPGRDPAAEWCDEKLAVFDGQKQTLLTQRTLRKRSVLVKYSAAVWLLDCCGLFKEGIYYPLLSFLVRRPLGDFQGEDIPLERCTRPLGVTRYSVFLCLLSFSGKRK